MAYKVIDVVTASLQELNVIAPGEPIPGPLGDFALAKFNRLVDNWNAMRAAVFAETFIPFTFVPNLTPHKIGPGATFDIAQRPVSIGDGQIAGNVVQNNVTPNVKTPIRLRDYAWYARVSVPDVTTTFPTDVYYEPDWGAHGWGALYFYPVPTVAYGCELIMRNLLAQAALDTTFTQPPGYWDAMIGTLAEMLAGPTGKVLTQEQKNQFRDARAQIFVNNDITPRISTRDAGMPDSRETDTRTLFNYRDRSWGGGSR